MGGTACPFPAFEGCYVVLGDGTEAPQAKAIPQAAEARKCLRSRLLSLRTAAS